MVPKKTGTLLVYLFIVAGQLAGLLNGVAAVLAARDREWEQAAGYLIIALFLSMVTIVAWYSMARQRPYNWRDGGRS
jgi:hypothetical protein